MQCISISREIALLPAGEDKRYVTAYKDVGFEFGFGRGGSYRGHSHLRFIDLIFALDGVRLRGDTTTDVKKLVIAPARTYLPDIEIGDFAFLKFCPDDCNVSPPDKVYQELHEQQILAFSDHAKLVFSWYPRPRAERQTVEVTLSGTELALEVGRSRFYLVGR